MRLTDVPVPLRQFFFFGLIGCVGFVVDSGVLYGLVRVAHLNPFVGRAFSYLAAASTTWFLNRRLTFAASRTDSVGREWLKFLFFNLAGGAVNYAVFAAYVKAHGSGSIDLVIGVALGSLSGMIVNFLVSRHFVFTAKGARS